jgi:hypothetical protein
MEQIIKSNKSEIDIISSLRDGSEDYDFQNIENIKQGGQGLVFGIKCKIDGKTYAVKRLNY